MISYSTQEIHDAMIAIQSCLNKSGKALSKLDENSWQHKRLSQALFSYTMSLDMFNKYLDPFYLCPSYSIEDKQIGLAFYHLSIQQIQKILPKFNAGIPQHTLAIRRIKAFECAINFLE